MHCSMLVSHGKEYVYQQLYNNSTKTEYINKIHFALCIDLDVCKKQNILN